MPTRIETATGYLVSGKLTNARGAPVGCRVRDPPDFVDALAVDMEADRAGELLTEASGALARADRRRAGRGELGRTLCAGRGPADRRGRPAGLPGGVGLGAGTGGPGRLALALSPLRSPPVRFESSPTPSRVFQPRPPPSTVSRSIRIGVRIHVPVIAERDMRARHPTRRTRSRNPGRRSPQMGRLPPDGRLGGHAVDGSSGHP
jgi:hypothetical protein